MGRIGSQHHAWIGLLNIFACLSVIIMHCNGAAFWNYADNLNWKIAVIVGALSDWAVPVFFMISGANLINYTEKYSTKVFAKKRLLKTLLPFILWSVIPLTYYYLRGKYSIQTISIPWLIDMVFNARINETYWFFIPLFSVYACIPVLSAIEKAKQKNIFCYLALTGGGTIFFLPLFSQMILQISYNNFFRMPMAGGYIVYAILGYLLKTEALCLKTRLIVYILGMAGFLVQSFGTVYLSVIHESLHREFQEGLGIPVLCESIAVFVLFKYEFSRLIKNQKINDIVNKLSSYSFGIYLIHMWIIRKIPSQIGDINNRELTWIISSVIFTYVISLCLTWTIKRMPFLRIVIP